MPTWSSNIAMNTRPTQPGMPSTHLPGTLHNGDWSGMAQQLASMQAQMTVLQGVLLQQSQHAPQAVSAFQPHAPVHSAAPWPAPAYTNPAMAGLPGNAAFISGAVSGNHNLAQPQQQQQYMATPTTGMPPQGPPPAHPSHSVALRRTQQLYSSPG